MAGSRLPGEHVMADTREAKVSAWISPPWSGCPSGGFILPPAQRDLGFREFLVSQGPGVLPGRNLRGTESGTSPALFSVPFPRLEVDTRSLISRSQRLLK